ncbi:receiver/sensor box histidine kinase [Natronomonas moolapensis 8.8.11]|uniref:histidine kinase n=1 Tax=Natronomonas moolapensis (strain DSM 18674 / CECT 7526 / JCM 14361 / 8.8.11) TaxID=268739 RepID=M1Y1V1_NATM8|nr:PAS domain S-box protein [Natronomonas moolapensis]CCQ36447.1 receiver/sensor box histidine kinase [Natronomonas moolapensis 8.8.11]
MTVPITVLHVDDDPAVADVTAEFLKRENDYLDVEATTSAEEALRILADRPPDCIVSDYDMPGTDGIEFLDDVRERYPELPFVLYTGKGSEEIAAEAISAGVTDYIQKQGGNERYLLLATRIRNAVKRYRAEKATEEQKEQLRLFFQESSIGAIQWDDTFRFKRLNDRAEEILGYEEAELRGESWETIVAADDRGRVGDVVSDLLDADGGRNILNRNVRKDGDVRICEWYNRVVTNEDGEVEAIFSQFQDVTERERRKRELAEHETIVSALPDAVYVIDEDGRFTHVNEELVELVGYDRETIIGNTPSLFKDDDAVEQAEGQLRRLLSSDGPETVSFEVTLQPRDGTPVVCEDHMGVLPYNGECFEGSVGTLRDVTDQKQRREELDRRTEELKALNTRLEAQYRQLFEEAPVMAVVTEMEGDTPIIEDCNRLFAERLGYERAAVVDEPLESFYAPESRRRLLDRGGYERALDGEFARERRKLLTADGETIETLLRAVPRRETDEDADSTLRLYVGLDGSEQLFRERERLDEFSSIVGHDLRSPLQVAEGRLELASEAHSSEHLDTARAALDRMDRIIEDVLWLARNGRDIGSVNPVPVGEPIEASWGLVSDAAEGATLRYADGLSEATIRVDEDRFRQLLENLFGNAIEHGGEGVTVTVGRVDDGLYVEDDGPGVAPAARDEIFGAGYSTSEDGTGFGLRIVERVAEAHGWAVRVVEGSDGGARFEITGIDSLE